MEQSQNSISLSIFEEETEVTRPTLLATKQNNGAPVYDFIERFRNLTLICMKGMHLLMLIQTYRYNLIVELESRMSVIKSHSWKELMQQADIIENLVNLNFSNYAAI